MKGVVRGERLDSPQDYIPAILGRVKRSTFFARTVLSRLRMPKIF